MPRNTAAGARNPAASEYCRQRPGSPPVSGGTTTGGSAVMPLMPSAHLVSPPRSPSLLERLRGRRLERLLRARDVARVLQEVLQDLPLALTDRRAERCRGEVGHVEPERLGVGQRLGRRLQQRIRVLVGRDVLVR